MRMVILTLKSQSKIVADILKKNYFSDKIKLGISCESSALQMIHMLCQVLFSLKKNNRINDVCCSCDWQIRV